MAAARYAAPAPVALQGSTSGEVHLEPFKGVWRITTAFLQNGRV